MDREAWNQRYAEPEMVWSAAPNRFRPDDITDDLAGFDGLRVIRADRVARPVMTDDGVRNAIDALVRAGRRATDEGHTRRLFS